MHLIAALLLVSPAPVAKVVAGTPNDLMMVRHVVLRGSNEQIGQQLAELAKKNHKVKAFTDLDAATLKARNAWFQKNYPEVMDRAKGVRKALGWVKGADYTSLPYNLDVRPACSVVYYPGPSVTNGHAMMSRNYDFPKASYAELTGRPAAKGARSMTGDPYVIEMHPKGGLSSLYISAYDLLLGTIDGVNEKGVTVALLADDMSKKRTRGRNGIGLGEVDLPRYVLDKATSAEHARELLRKVPYYASFIPCHYIVGDPSGDSFIFEVDENDRIHIIDGRGKPQIITNHSIHKYDANKLPNGNSFDRYRRLQQEIANRKNRVTPAEVKEINYCVAVPADVKVHATLWHSVYDLKDKTLKVSFCLSRSDEAKERRTPYLSFRLGR